MRNGHSVRFGCTWNRGCQRTFSAVGYKQQLLEIQHQIAINFSRLRNYNLWQVKFIYYIAEESQVVPCARSALTMNN